MKKDFNKTPVREFIYKVTTTLVASVTSEVVLLEQDVNRIYQQMSANGITWNKVIRSPKGLLFYQTTKSLVEMPVDDHPEVTNSPAS